MTPIRTGAVIDRCVLDKEIEIGANAEVGVARTPRRINKPPALTRHHPHR
jgi:ADP-glucose pyrophosphorylase